MNAFLAVTMALPKSFVLFVTLALVALIGWFDFVTGWEWDGSAIYAIPIVLGVWRMDRRVGFALAFLCMGAWWAARMQGHPYQTDSGLALAIIVRLLLFSVVVVAVAAVKAQRAIGRAQIEMLERTRTLERDILRTSEQEQQRIGRDLHDGLCQTLAGIAALSAAFSRRLASGSETDPAAATAEITKLLNEAIGEARDLARGLGNTVLREVGLSEALEELAFKVRHLFGVSCVVTFDKILMRPDDEIAAHLFRIAQEAVNNAVAHGRADRIEIDLGETDRDGYLSVRDNGVGLSEAALHGDGIGLRTMADRARLIGGSIELQRQELGGTAVTCIFPLPETPVIRENSDDARHDN